MRVHAYAHACSSFVCAYFMHAYAYMGMRAHVRVPETRKDMLFCIKNLVWNESHIVWELPQTLIFNYIKPEMVDLHRRTNFEGKHTRFTRK